MKKIVLTTLVFFILFNGNSIAQKVTAVKVACIGNSITFGARIEDRIKDAYPEQLGRMLGEEYLVKKFGVSGRTLLSKGNAPYIKTGAYQKSLEFNPDIIIIKLGTNSMAKPISLRH